MAARWLALAADATAVGESADEAAQRLAELVAEPFALDRIYVVRSDDVHAFEAGVYQVPHTWPDEAEL